MSRKRLIPAVMALGLLSAMALGAPAAQATHDDDTMGEASCVLAPGSVAGTTIGVDDEDGVNGLGYDNTNGLLDTDPGHFDFEGDAICTGFDVASETTPANRPIIPPTTFAIEAAGDYDNLVCGTGTANGDARLFGPVVPVGEITPIDVEIYTEFGIKFVAGVGQLSFVVDADETGVPRPSEASETHGQYASAPSQDQLGYVPAGFYGPAGTHSHVGNNQVDGGEGQGVIVITPNPGPPIGPAPASAGNCESGGMPAGNVTSFLVNGAFYGFLSGEGDSDSDSIPSTGITPEADSDN